MVRRQPRSLSRRNWHSSQKPPRPLGPRGLSSMAMLWIKGICPPPAMAWLMVAQRSRRMNNILNLASHGIAFHGVKPYQPALLPRNYGVTISGSTPHGIQAGPGESAGDLKSAACPARSSEVPWIKILLPKGKPVLKPDTLTSCISNPSSASRTAATSRS